MNEPTPRVSIGLAVYNGEQFLSEAIDSILAQTFSDFELILADNASADRTAEICLAYAAKDQRIRYHRHPTNIGGANNENYTFTVARGQYFHLAAHDDRLAPQLLARCVAVLDQQPAVTLCYSAVEAIDETGRFLHRTSRSLGLASQPYQRFRQVISRNHTCDIIYGVIRSDVLRKTRLQQNYTDSDRTLLGELALYGPFYQIDEALFAKRYHPKNRYIDWRARMAWFNPAWKGKIVFPNWLQVCDFFVTVRRVPLSFWQRWACYAVIGEWLLRFGRGLLRDLWVALVMSLHSVEWRKERAVTNWE